MPGLQTKVSDNIRGALRSLQTPLDAASHSASRQATTGDTGTSPLLEVCGLHAGYHRKEILHGIDFTMDKGSFMCIIGANGCGKTTALKAILGLLTPFAGTVKVNGHDSLKLSERQRARCFAYIPQAHTPPFPFKVADVVLLGRTPYINSLSRVSDNDRMIAWRSLCQLKIEHLAERTYTHLSGGQQQLILVARALAQQADLIVMDEPTASLDFGNQQTVLNSVRALVEAGNSVLMVTHDPGHALQYADRVLVMFKGKVIMDGAPFDVITTESMRAIYGTDIEVVEVSVDEGRKARVCIPL